LLAKSGIDFEEIPRDDESELGGSLSAANRSRPTPPAIVVADSSVGGATDLASVHRRGEVAFLFEGTG
jgi:glutaredoxin